ncbi:MAG TPA: hypothetical protein PLN52_19100 [Opitutaceae bacterium]|nr:hypothetical protein [Opitutaceae bacterium]
MAVIALLGGSLGLALSGDNIGRSLQEAQALLSANLTAARTHAALARRATRMLIFTGENRAGIADDVAWRYLELVAENDSGEWEVVGAGNCLPKRIRLVPKVLPTTVSSETWVATALSNLSGEVELRIRRAGQEETVSCLYVEFTPLGNTSVATLVVSPARRFSGSTGPLIYDRPDAVRGVKLSQYGAQTLLPGIESF